MLPTSSASSHDTADSLPLSIPFLIHSISSFFFVYSCHHSDTPGIWSLHRPPRWSISGPWRAPDVKSSFAACFQPLDHLEVPMASGAKVASSGVDWPLATGEDCSISCRLMVCRPGVVAWQLENGNTILVLKFTVQNVWNARQAVKIFFGACWPGKRLYGRCSIYCSRWIREQHQHFSRRLNYFNIGFMMPY